MLERLDFKILVSCHCNNNNNYETNCKNNLQLILFEGERRMGSPLVHSMMTRYFDSYFYVIKKVPKAKKKSLIN